MGKEKKGETARMDMPTVPPPSLQETENVEEKNEAEEKVPPKKKAVKKKKKKNRPRKFDFSMNGAVAGRMCPICHRWDTEQINTIKNIQYRRCKNQTCPGSPRDGNKKTYKVVGVEVDA